MINEKRPRQYAAEIMALRGPQERREALERVPEIWRPLTKKHVEIGFDRKRALHLWRQRRGYA